jgi:hypothetical protein
MDAQLVKIKREEIRKIFLRFRIKKTTGLQI